MVATLSISNPINEIKAIILDHHAKTAFINKAEPGSGIVSNVREAANSCESIFYEINSSYLIQFDFEYMEKFVPAAFEVEDNVVIHFTDFYRCDDKIKQEIIKFSCTDFIANVTVIISGVDKE